jgi:membrane dipeptidase
MKNSSPIIDCLQYSNWSKKTFEQMNEGNVSAVHVTICYHEDFRETVENVSKWNERFQEFDQYIFHGQYAADIDAAKESGRTAIFYGFQNCSPIEDDIGLVEVWHQLGARFMQLSYNNQSLLATGCYEANDPGITRMGKQVIKEMNRVGMVVDMSHSAHRSTLEAIDLSQRPIAITHANPASWHNALRNKPDAVLTALAQNGGMLGFSMYPHHLRNKSDCTLDDFCDMIKRAADVMGVDHIGFGSDLCQDQPDSVVEWMRNGTWTKDKDFGEGSASAPGFPAQPEWFRDNRDFPGIIDALRQHGFSQEEVGKIAGGNWYRFYADSFTLG